MGRIRKIVSSAGFLLAPFMAGAAFLGVQLLVSRVVLLLWVVLCGGPASSPSDVAALSERAGLLAQLACVALAIPVLRRMRAGCVTPPGFARGGGVRMVCLLVTLGISVQLALMLVLTLALPLIPDLLADYTQVMDSLGSDSLVSSLTLVAGAPLAEEFCFRGVGMRLALRGTRRPWLACVIQALAFGAAHLNLVQGAYAFAIGILLGVVALRTGRLWTCVLLHASVNAASYLPDLLSLIPTSLYAASLLFAGTLGLVGVAVGVRLLLQASYFESTGEA